MSTTSADIVSLRLQFLGQIGGSFHVADTNGLGIATQLPISQVAFRSDDLARAIDARASGRRAILQIEVPAWLARDRNLVAVPDPLQGRLL